MRRLMLTTVSVMALGLGGAGLTYAAGDMGSSPERTPGSTTPSTTGTAQPGNTQAGAGTSGGSTTPSTTATSQPGSTGTVAGSTMPAMTGKSHGRTSGRMGWRNEVREVQQRLQQDNLYHGRIDGIYGPVTKQALRQYQRSNGLRVTASLDRETRDSLLGTGAVGQGSTTPPSHRLNPSHAGGSAYKAK